MKTRTEYSLMAIFVTAVSLPAYSQAQEAEKPPHDKAQVQVRVTRTDEDDNEKLRFTVEVNDPAMSKYWIGVLCEPVESELVKSQLHLNFGLVIEEVIEGGPAEEAGLKKLDILTEVDGKPLDGLPMLGKCIAESNGGKLQLTVVRGGDRQQIAIVPAERPEKFQTPLPAPAKDDPRTVDERKLLDEALRGFGVAGRDADDNDDEREQGRRSLYYFLPGFVLPGEAKDFPENLEVSVTKVSGKPTKIVVKRGDEKWEVDEENLDKLPADIRPHIERMLGGRGQFGWSTKPLVVPELDSIPQFNIQRFRFDPDLNLKLEEKRGQLHLQMSEDVRKKVEKQLDELQKKVERAKPALTGESLEQIRRELTKLRKELEKLHADSVKRSTDDEDAGDHEHDDDAAHDHNGQDDKPLSLGHVWQIMVV